MYTARIIDPTTDHQDDLSADSYSALEAKIQAKLDGQNTVKAHIARKTLPFSVLYGVVAVLIAVLLSPQLAIVVLVMTLLVCAWVPIWLNPYKQWLRGWIRACMWSNQLKRLQAARQSTSPPEE